MKQTLSNPLIRALDTFLEGRTGGWIINIVVIPGLILLALMLPPIAIPSRILNSGFINISPTNGGTFNLSDGAQFSIPPGQAKTAVSIRLSSQARDAFMKSAVAKNLPSTLDVKSPGYFPSMQGAAPALSILSLPIPDGADPLSTLTVYGYVAKKWTKLPFQIYTEDERVETYLGTTIPEAVVVALTQAQSPTLSADISGKAQLVSQVNQLIAEMTAGGLLIADDGSINGALAATPATSTPIYPTITNVLGDQIRGDWVDAMITTPDIEKQHISAIVDLATEKTYPGINIDYQNVSPDNRTAFTAFIRDLAGALQAKNKILSVTLPLPTQLAADNWDTGAYDWASIGDAADVVTIPIQVSRDAYTGDNPVVQSYLTWAVGRVDHFKLQVGISLLGRDEFGTSFAPVGFGSALRLMGPTTLPTTIAAGDKVTLDLKTLRDAGGLKSDAVTGLYSFTYKDSQGTAHSVLIENAESLAKKMALALQYNLRGIVVRDLGVDTVDPRVYDALRRYRDGEAPAYKGAPAIVWRVNGQSIGKATPNDPKTTWTADQAGDAKIEAVLSFDGGQTIAGSAGVLPVQIARSSEPPPAPVSSGPAAGPGPAVRPTTAPRPVAAPPSQFAGKNLFGYGIQVQGGDPAGEAGDIKGLGFGWVKIQVVWRELETSKGNINWGGLDNFVGAMNGSGIKVLLSVVKAPDWSRTQNKTPGEGPPDNMQDAADFMGAAAARYCNKGVGAIEVWNEENLDVEWHDKRGLTAAIYMDMLKRARNSIRTSCPDIIVVSGAPTPNGLNSGTAIDDVVFLQQLYANGLKDNSDAIGVHPSGFRSPPDATMSTPGAVQDYANHRSFFFRMTLESYRQVMVQNGDGNKQLWPTEFGWPVGTGGGAHPAGQYNSATDVANYYKRAYELGKQWGWVGVMFAWQLDFSGGEVGAFRIKGSPTYGALQQLPH